MVLRAPRLFTFRLLAKNHVIAFFWECSIAKVETRKVMLPILMTNLERFMKIWLRFEPRNILIKRVKYLFRIFHLSDKEYQR